MKLVRAIAVVLSLALTLAASAGARAATFGVNLDAAVANNPYGCGAVYLSACTVMDPQHLDMELWLPDPIQNGDQTGVVTAMHVKYPDGAPPTPVQFVVVEWSGQPGAGQPFPSGVMAISKQVTLRPGMNNFTTDLPVDYRLADNGFESWSQIALTMLDGSAPVPGQLGGSNATTGLILDNYQPLTSTIADLTVVPHNPQISGFYPMTLLMSGDLTNTTEDDQPAADDGTADDLAGDKGYTATDDTGDTDTGTASTATLTFPGSARRAGGNLPLALACAGTTNCAGTLVVRGRGRKAVTYAKGTFSIAAGRAASVRTTLTRAGKKALRKHHRVTAIITATFADGHSATSRKIALKP